MADVPVLGGEPAKVLPPLLYVGGSRHGELYVQQPDKTEPPAVVDNVAKAERWLRNILTLTLTNSLTGQPMGEYDCYVLVLAGIDTPQEAVIGFQDALVRRWLMEHGIRKGGGPQAASNGHVPEVRYLADCEECGTHLTFTHPLERAKWLQGHLELGHRPTWTDASPVSETGEPA